MEQQQKKGDGPVRCVYNKQQANIVEQLKEKKFAVILDETTNVMGRYVVNVLLQLLVAFAGADNCRPLLVNTEFLEEVNNSTMSQVVIRTLSNLNVDFNDVLAFISDNAAYMKKCFTDRLKGILPNTVHITCWAHSFSHWRTVSLRFATD